MNKYTFHIGALVLMNFIGFASAQSRPVSPIAISVNWNKVVRTSRSTPTLQVVLNPPLRRGNIVHDGAFAALHGLGADFVRYVPWLPYPKLAVAELQPPTASTTSWDFSLIDPMTIDFFNATKGHSVILNFSTIPQWMYKTPKPIGYPADPNKVDWKYEKGTTLRDPSLKELAGYYARLVSWYCDGGFTDENEKRHESGYHYSIPYWEVFNEIDFEHHITPQEYTKCYDAITAAIHAVSPHTRFVGLALAGPKHLSYLKYFLDPKNHKPGTPLDMISYHFYAVPKMKATGDDLQSIFAQAKGFVGSVREIEAIRQRLSPATKTDIDEIGTILRDDNSPGADKRIVPIYWNASGGMYAYLYVELSKLGIDVIGESQLVGYPSQFPSVTMIDWKNGKPNARFWILKLLKDNFGPGDTICATACDPANADIEVQGFRTSHGRRLLITNKRNSPQVVTLPAEAKGGSIEEVNLSTRESAPQRRKLGKTTVMLSPFEVAVVDMGQSR